MRRRRRRRRGQMKREEEEEEALRENGRMNTERADAFIDFLCVGEKVACFVLKKMEGLKTHILIKQS